MMMSSNIFRVNGPLWGEFTGHRWIPSQRPVTRSFDVFFDLRLSKPSRRWWFETPSRSLRRHCKVASCVLVLQVCCRRCLSITRSRLFGTWALGRWSAVFQVAGLLITIVAFSSPYWEDWPDEYGDLYSGLWTVCVFNKCGSLLERDIKGNNSANTQRNYYAKTSFFTE